MSIRTLDGDATAAVRHLQTDPALAPLVDAHGVLTVRPADDAFERLVVAILRQQVSMASAAAVRERLFSRVTVTPEGIAETDADLLREVGLSRQKARYLHSLADAYLTRGLEPESFRDESDAAVVDRLTTIDGIGTWTAKMFLIFCLAREDVFPVEDLGIRRGMQALFGDELTRAEMRARAADWRPYRSVASLYLWREFG